MILFDSIREFAKECWQTSEDHGWHDTEDMARRFKSFMSQFYSSELAGRKGAAELLEQIERRFFRHGGVQVMEKLMLIDTEVSEAAEDYRAVDSTVLNSLYYIDKSGERLPMTLEAARAGNKPLGFMSEAADVIIRVFDLCESLGGDIAHALECKAAFNKTRPFRHGGKTV